MNDVPARLANWLDDAGRDGASDLHPIAGHPPVARVHGDLIERREPPLAPDEAEPLFAAICPPGAFEQLETKKNVDFSFRCGSARFRANLFQTDRRLGACFRVIPNAIPDLDWAGFPIELADRLANIRDGLVIVTGPTGAGKSTTLAMIVQRVNSAGGSRIITVEEPVEYVFPQAANSLITQREVGVDVLTLADGLKYGLRQDPDAILVGEIRDRETAQMALSAAETGHLVFTTLHTRDAKGAVTRFADLFPQDAQLQVRSQLALGLRAVIGQRLLPGNDRAAKRQLAIEVLWNTHPVASAIRQGKVESIDNCMVTGRADGMLTFDESVRQLFKAGRIARAVAEKNVSDPGLLFR